MTTGEQSCAANSDGRDAPLIRRPAPGNPRIWASGPGTRIGLIVATEQPVRSGTDDHAGWPGMVQDGSAAGGRAGFRWQGQGWSVWRWWLTAARAWVSSRTSMSHPASSRARRACREVPRQDWARTGAGTTGTSRRSRSARCRAPQAPLAAVGGDQCAGVVGDAHQSVLRWDAPAGALAAGRAPAVRAARPQRAMGTRSPRRARQARGGSPGRSWRPGLRCGSRPFWGR